MATKTSEILAGHDIFQSRFGMICARLKKGGLLHPERVAEPGMHGKGENTYNAEETDLLRTVLKEYSASSGPIVSCDKGVMEFYGKDSRQYHDYMNNLKK
jgi:hypothetical protein